MELESRRKKGGQSQPQRNHERLMRSGHIETKMAPGVLNEGSMPPGAEPTLNLFQGQGNVNSGCVDGK